MSRWVLSLAARSHTNVAAVALANKTARIAWAMIRNGTDYQEELAASPVKEKLREMTEGAPLPVTTSASSEEPASGLASGV